ncbi:hypothetical protein RJT34_28716 [Clitoria ternatea]|uniref:Uncharacterized protein n=1 Tax=Clitoria ternatea TaxID=43366 RepID=A0AAN9FI08_CLITE
MGTNNLRIYLIKKVFLWEEGESAQLNLVHLQSFVALFLSVCVVGSFEEKFHSSRVLISLSLFPPPLSLSR